MLYAVAVPEDSYKFALRLPPDLRVALEELAKKERRSLNAQIVYLLQAAVEPPK